MAILTLSTSLNPESRSRVLTQQAYRRLEELDETVRFVDLQDHTLPLCDGEDSYDHPEVAIMNGILADANVILMGVAIYNFDINAAAKNLVELTGKRWENKVVGFLCAAGGRSSYMSVMSFANSLMLDFRSLILPRFVYAVYEDFSEHPEKGLMISSKDISNRIDNLCQVAVQFSNLPLKM